MVDDGDPEELRQEVSRLNQEYSQLREQLTKVEKKYQTAVTNFQNEKTAEGDEKGVGYNHRLLIFISSLFDETHYSDIKILLQYGRQLNGHKLILASRSNNWGVSNFLQTDVLDLTDIDYNVAIAVIKWIYTNDINLNQEEGFVIDVIKMAVKFNLDSLSSRCQKTLIKEVNCTNAEGYYYLAEQIYAEKLKVHCKDLLSIGLSTVNTEIKKDTEQLDLQKYGVKINIQKSLSEDKLCNKIFLNSEEPQLDLQNECDNIITTTDVTPVCERQEFSSVVNKSPNKFIYKIRNETFKTRTIKKEHKVKTHPIKNRYSCETCDKHFSKKSHYDSHTRVHTGERPFPCEVCDKRFKERGTLRDHMLTHSDERAFACKLCDRRFRAMKSLKLHMCSHTGVKLYVCDTCGKSSATWTLLKNHMRLHDKSSCLNYICSTCGHAFTQKVHLKAHEMIHSGEKPHQCTYCGKTFTDKSCFNRHIKIHTGVKPHKCNICDKAFIQRSQLLRHNSVHNNS